MASAGEFARMAENLRSTCAEASSTSERSSVRLSCSHSASEVLPWSSLSSASSAAGASAVPFVLGSPFSEGAPRMRMLSGLRKGLKKLPAAEPHGVQEGHSPSREPQAAQRRARGAGRPRELQSRVPLPSRQEVAREALAGAGAEERRAARREPGRAL